MADIEEKEYIKYFNKITKKYIATIKRLVLYRKIQRDRNVIYVNPFINFFGACWTNLLAYMFADCEIDSLPRAIESDCGILERITINIIKRFNNENYVS